MLFRSVFVNQMSDRSGCQDFAVRGAPRTESSLLHDIKTVRGLDKSKDQILMRTSAGSIVKR